MLSREKGSVVHLLTIADIHKTNRRGQVEMVGQLGVFPLVELPAAIVIDRVVSGERRQ